MPTSHLLFKYQNQGEKEEVENGMAVKGGGGEGRGGGGEGEGENHLVEPGWDWGLNSSWEQLQESQSQPLVGSQQRRMGSFEGRE